MVWFLSILYNNLTIGHDLRFFSLFLEHSVEFIHFHFGQLNQILWGLDHSIFLKAIMSLLLQTWILDNEKNDIDLEF